MLEVLVQLNQSRFEAGVRQLQLQYCMKFIQCGTAKTVSDFLVQDCQPGQRYLYAVSHVWQVRVPAALVLAVRRHVQCATPGSLTSPFGWPGTGRGHGGFRSAIPTLKVQAASASAISPVKRLRLRAAAGWQRLYTFAKLPQAVRKLSASLIVRKSATFQLMCPHLDFAAMPCFLASLLLAKDK